MRPGRTEDIPAFVQLWRHEVEIGRQDAARSQARTRSVLGRFDWDIRSRVVERDGGLQAAALVIARQSVDGMLADIYPVGIDDAYFEVLDWALRFARAAGAALAHIIVAKDHGAGLEPLGLRPVRPWWRMDARLPIRETESRPVPGYELVDGAGVKPGVWAETFNRSFADHWRFAPRGEPEIVAGKPAELCLMAVTSPGGRPAAITLGEVEDFLGDSRPQPVGLVSSVGTVPEHRRRGLAGWLVGETLLRLQRAGARHASLYVDGMNPTRAYDVYKKLGFEVAYEAEVWEATFP